MAELFVRQKKLITKDYFVEFVSCCSLIYFKSIVYGFLIRSKLL